VGSRKHLQWPIAHLRSTNRKWQLENRNAAGPVTTARRSSAQADEYERRNLRTKDSVPCDLSHGETSISPIFGSGKTLGPSQEGDDIVCTKRKFGEMCIGSKSPYRRPGLAPRCRLIASSRWSRWEGFGCSPIKAVRELGSVRRETVRSLSTVGAGTLRVSRL
jgi:hypothetical protein